MAKRALQPCGSCGKLSRSTYCPAHKEESWSKTRGTAHERGYGQQWRKLRIKVLRRDKHTCQLEYQGCELNAKEVDHITPKSQGGSDGYDNLQATCGNCHKIKTQKESIGGRGGQIATT